MTVFNPSYLVQSRHGIWYFQMQVPPNFRKNNSRTLIRRSLRTRDRNVALSRSKFWYLKVVELDYDLSSLNSNETSKESDKKSSQSDDQGLFSRILLGIRREVTSLLMSFWSKFGWYSLEIKASPSELHRSHQLFDYLLINNNPCGGARDFDS